MVSSNRYSNPTGPNFLERKIAENEKKLIENEKVAFQHKPRLERSPVHK